MMYFIGIVILVLTYFTIFFLVAQKLKNNAIVDIGWGLGFALMSVYTIVYTVVNRSITWTIAIVSLAIILWGLRLFLYIGIRNFKKPEDFRYVAMRKSWEGKNIYVQAFFKVFMLQAMFMLMIAFPLYASYMYQDATPNMWLFIGLGLFSVGFFFEAVGDYQLRRFLKIRKDKSIMQSGLWKYTRHPNYLGETVMWWALWIMVIPTNWGLIAVISPITITILLLFVSGIPLLEEKYKDNKLFQAYKQRTSAFFPWFPKKEGVKNNENI